MTGAEFAFYYSTMVTTGADLPDLTDVFERPAWHAQAVCRGVDVSIFFPALGESTAPAKALCATCPWPILAAPTRSATRGGKASGVAPRRGSAQC